MPTVWWYVRRFMGISAVVGTIGYFSFFAIEKAKPSTDQWPTAPEVGSEQANRMRLEQTARFESLFADVPEETRLKVMKRWGALPKNDPPPEQEKPKVIKRVIIKKKTSENESTGNE